MLTGNPSDLVVGDMLVDDTGDIGYFTKEDSDGVWCAWDCFNVGDPAAYTPYGTLVYHVPKEML